mgnify:CR=1 FL=1
MLRFDDSCVWLGLYVVLIVNVDYLVCYHRQEDGPPQPHPREYRLHRTFILVNSATPIVLR